MRRLWLSLLCAVLSACGVASGAPQATRPNIVFVLVDDLSADLLRYMDNTRALADGGTSFTNYFVSNSLCCPSRATMFTGEHPHNTGVETNVGHDHGGYPAFQEHEKRTYAAELHRAGYRTGYAGKYINGYKVTPEGFTVPPGWDEWHSPGGGGYNELDFTMGTYIREEGVTRVARDRENYLTDRLAATAEQFLTRSRQHAPGKPFFLQVAPYSPHSRVPYTPGGREPRFPAALRDRPADAGWPGAQFPRGDCGGPDCASLDVARELPGFDEDTADKPGWVRRAPLTDGEVRELRTDFRDRVRMVQSVDDLIGRVLGALTPAERANTYVVFSADNGFHLGQHRLLRGKSTAYDHDVRVPLLVRRPGGTGGAVVRRDLVQNVDLFATFLDIAGVSPAVRDSRDGRSVLGLVHDRDQAGWRDAAYVEHREPAPAAPGEDPDAEEVSAANAQPPSYRAVRTATDLYVEYANGEREYYDLTADPGQETNRPDHPRAAQLAAPLARLGSCGRTGTGCWQAAHVGVR